MEEEKEKGYIDFTFANVMELAEIAQDIDDAEETFKSGDGTFHHINLIYDMEDDTFAFIHDQVIIGDYMNKGLLWREVERVVTGLKEELPF